MHDSTADSPFVKVEAVDRFADRLREAIATCPRRLGVKLTRHQFVDELAKRSSHTKKVPASYRTVALYLNGERRPRDSRFAQAAAELLQVRWQWLHAGSGPMLDTVRVESTMTKTAPVQLITGTHNPAGPRATLERIQQIADEIKDYRPALAVFMDVWEQVLQSSAQPVTDTEHRYRVAETLWHALLAPLDAVGVDAADVPPPYYVAALAALLPIIPGPGKGTNHNRTARKPSPSARRKT